MSASYDHSTHKRNRAPRAQYGRKRNNLPPAYIHPPITEIFRNDDGRIMQVDPTTNTECATFVVHLWDYVDETSAFTVGGIFFDYDRAKEALEAVIDLDEAEAEAAQ